MSKPHDAARLTALGAAMDRRLELARSGAGARALRRRQRDDLGPHPLPRLRCQRHAARQARLREYWGLALQRLPNLHFDLIDLYVSPDSLVVFYANERGQKICEYLRVDADGKIRQGSANHLMH